MFNTIRQTALLKAAPRTEWGGTYVDSPTYAKIFRSAKPHNFGVMGAQTFSRQVDGDMVDKGLYWLTMGQGNYMELPGGTSTYTWTLVNDGIPRAKITGVDPNLGTYPGVDGDTFEICLDRNSYHTPGVLMVEDRDAPGLYIHGYPRTESPTRHWYTVSLQTSRADDYIDPDFLQVGRVITDGFTSIADEMSTKHAGIELGSSSDLQGQIGYFARKAEFTDKTIRMDMEGSASGKPAAYNYDGKTHSGLVSTGYVVAPNYDKAGNYLSDNQRIQAGMFMTNVEALLEHRLTLDKEMAALKGKTETSVDPDTGYTRTMGAGWLEMAKDGHYREHTGNLLLGDLSTKFSALSVGAISPENRKFIIRTGSDGMEMADAWIRAESTLYPRALDSSNIVYQTNNNSFDKEYGFGMQFTEIRMVNGLTLVFMYDPMKDNTFVFPQINPVTGNPLESSSFDILDIGVSESAPLNANTRSNMAWIYEPAAEVYAHVSNVYDFNTGSVKDGSAVASFDKMAGVYRESSGKFEIFDISRCGRFARV